MTRLDAAHFQVHLHAIGDRAVREALDAIAAARAANGPGGASANRHHIAHLQVVHPDDVRRFARLGVTANVQALWAAHEPQMDELTIPFLGPERAARQYLFRDLLRRRGPAGRGQRLGGEQRQPDAGRPRGGEPVAWRATTPSRSCPGSGWTWPRRWPPTRSARRT